jgi:primosomal protein N' (replication factor Y)
MPDFRAAERTFQTLVQVAGRAGRGDTAGRVLFQTYQPEDTTLKAAVLQDYERFYGEELQRRKAHGFPPFMRLVRILLTSQNEKEVVEAADKLENLLLPLEDSGLRLLGPSAAPLERIKGQYRWHLMLQATQPTLLAQAIEKIEAADLETRTRRVIIDVDPVSML